MVVASLRFKLVSHFDCFMQLVEAVFLGFLQGIAEWLPVSSQGQVMVFAINLFGIAPETAFDYAIFLHVGTLIAATVYFRKEIVEIAKSRDRPMLSFLFFGLVGSAITGIPAYFFLKSFLQSPFSLMMLIGLALIATGFLQFGKKPGKEHPEKFSGILTGLGQGFSVIPGISRSGVTASALLFQGFKPEQAFRLSFILSIPSVFLAELAFGLAEGISFEPMVLVAIAVAAIVGFASIDLLLKIAKRINFSYFCFALGILYLGLAFV